MTIAPARRGIATYYPGKRQEPLTFNLTSEGWRVLKAVQERTIRSRSDIFTHLVTLHGSKTNYYGSYPGKAPKVCTINLTARSWKTLKSKIRTTKRSRGDILEHLLRTYGLALEFKQKT